MFEATNSGAMRKLFLLLLFVLLALPALGQGNDITLQRFSVNQSSIMNDFQSPEHIYGNVEFSFNQDVTMVEAVIHVLDGTGKVIGGTAVVNHWGKAASGQKIEYDYTYYNPSAVQTFKPVLVVTARGADGSHIHKSFQAKADPESGNPIGY